MIIATQRQTLVVIGNPHFAKGYQLGRLWYFGYDWEGEIDDEYRLTNVLSYMERGLNNHPDWLAQHLGFLMGMVSGKFLAE